MIETSESLVLDVGERMVELVASERPMPLSTSPPPRPHSADVKTLSLMRAISDLIRQRRVAEVMVLARSPADHVITIGWIAIDPEQHFPRWEKADAQTRLDAHDRWEGSTRSIAAVNHARVSTAHPRAPVQSFLLT